MCYKLHQPGKVRWSLYDLQGRLMTQGLSGTQPVGEYTIQLELARRGLSDGAYLFQLTCETNDGVFHAIRRVSQLR